MVTAAMSEEEFAHTIEGLKKEIHDLNAIIREAMTVALGEVPAVVALSYTGDLGDGDGQAFAKRIQELFGDGSQKVLGVIVIMANQRLKIASETKSNKVQ